MILYMTYCSGKKNPSGETPDTLYTSKRIQDFINYCKEKKLPYAILSAKYGILFPDDKVQDYDVTMKSDNRFWRGIRVVIDNKKLNREESKRHVENLIRKVKNRIESENIEKIYFYAPIPRRVKTYLAILHIAMDNCNETHKVRELLEHIKEKGNIIVFTSFSKLPKI